MVEVSRNERILGPLEVGLRRDLHVTRQPTRGGPRYIIHDPVSFQNHAFSTTDYRILTAIVPTRTLGETFDILVDRGLLENTQSDREGFFRFVLWLHDIGLLHLPLQTGDASYERYRKRREAKRARWYSALMSHRIPLGNPDAMLKRTMPWVGWLFSGRGLLLWSTLMGIVFWKCAGRFDELLTQTTTMLALSNLPLLWTGLILLKALHEFGHAYACRRFGAPVPEMGIVMIMMTPCAYVDASASWRLMNRRHRAIVALGGIYVESFVAAAAALVWAGTAPGLMHDFAFNVVVLASVVTVLFNLNPLMRYDGYYLFSDLVGVFNLQQRSLRFLNSWIAHLVLGAPRPATRYSRGEKLLYGIYGPATFVWRLLLAVGIARLVMMRWPSAGLMLAFVFLWALLVQPALRMLLSLWQTEAPELRTRARLVAVGSTTLLPLIVSLMPISWHVTTSGILDPLDRKVIRAPTAGFVRAIHVSNGETVAEGEVLCELYNPQLEARELGMQGELDAERVSLDAIELDDPTQAQVHESRIRYLEAGLEGIRNKLGAMSLRSTIPGTVSHPRKLELEGRFLQQGDELLRVQSGHSYLRVVLSEEDVSRARLELGGTAEVRFTCNPSVAVSAKIHEIRAAASREEVPLALTMLGGGDVYATPIGETGDRAVADRPYLHVLLEIDTLPLGVRGAGLTARVRFPARTELLGTWIRRRILTFLNAWRMT